MSYCTLSDGSPYHRGYLWTPMSSFSPKRLIPECVRCTVCGCILPANFTNLEGEPICDADLQVNTSSYVGFYFICLEETKHPRQKLPGVSKGSPKRRPTCTKFRCRWILPSSMLYMFNMQYSNWGQIHKKYKRAYIPLRMWKIKPWRLLTRGKIQKNTVRWWRYWII